jgi:hypothetical protein
MTHAAKCAGKADRIAPTPGGKDERLQQADFLALSAIAGLRTADSHAAIDEARDRMRATFGRGDLSAQAR